MTHPLSFAAHGESDIVMTRVFDAPRDRVFDAWTRPELLCRWLGVWGEWTMPICEVDLRVGGEYRFVWRKSSGTEMGVRGVYREIVRSQRIVNTEQFDEPWYPGEALITHELVEERGRTTSRVTMAYQSSAARDSVLATPVESGIERGYAALDELLSES